MIDSKAHSEIIQKIIGPVEPIGETRTDEKRLENLKHLVYVTHDLVLMIYQVAENINHYESSRITAAKEAIKCLESIKDYTDYIPKPEEQEGK